MFDFMMATAPEIGAELGHRLRARRMMQGWSQVELVQRAGLSSGTIKNLESKGQASLTSFIQIVAALGLSDDLGELFRLKALNSRNATCRCVPKATAAFHDTSSGFPA